MHDKLVALLVANGFTEADVPRVRGHVLVAMTKGMCPDCWRGSVSRPLGYDPLANPTTEPPLDGIIPEYSAHASQLLINVKAYGIESGGLAWPIPFQGRPKLPKPTDPGYARALMAQQLYDNALAASSGAILPYPSQDVVLWGGSGQENSIWFQGGDILPRNSVTIPR